jgi:hypothetical protein
MPFASVHAPVDDRQLNLIRFIEQKPAGISCRKILTLLSCLPEIVHDLCSYSHLVSPAGATLFDASLAAIPQAYQSRASGWRRLHDEGTSAAKSMDEPWQLASTLLGYLGFSGGLSS